VTEGQLGRIHKPGWLPVSHHGATIDRHGLWASDQTGWLAGAREGALIGYGPDQIQMYRRAPFYVARILKGTKAVDAGSRAAQKKAPRERG